MNLTLQEQETHLNLTAEDRGTWHVYSDDPIMQRRLESIGAEITKIMADGVDKEYALRADQVLLRKGKRQSAPLSEAQLANLRKGRGKSRTLDGSQDEIEPDVELVESITETVRDA